MKGGGSQNCKRRREVGGWGTVKATDYEHFGLHSKLIDTLSLAVHAKVEETKKDALLQLQGLSAEEKNNNTALVGVPSTNNNLTNTAANQEASAAAANIHRRSQMVTSVVIGDIAVSFECPQQFTANNVDMELAASCYRHFLERDGVVTSPMKPLQFSFRERLQNWNIQCRMRPRGRLDMFYRYPRGKRSFRSVNEVVDFMLYEICPDTTYKQDMPQDQDNNEVEAAAAAAGRAKRRKCSIYRGRRRRKHRRTKGKAQQKAANPEGKAAAAAADVDDDEDADKNVQEDTNPRSPQEPQEETSPDADADLLNVSDDLSAYESLFDEYFDEF